jgi:hypothetical protein
MTETSEPPKEAPLQSGIFIPPGEKLLSEAIADTLRTPPEQRAAVFEAHARRIEALIARTAPEHPWTCTAYIGTDGSHIFRGGVGHSLVIDPQGRLWRARSYEDFETTYVDTGATHVIDTLTPLYHQMREYLPRPG